MRVSSVLEDDVYVNGVLEEDEEDDRNGGAFSNLNWTLNEDIFIT